MSRVSLILALALATCSGHPAFAKPFHCANIPWWIKNYSFSQIAPALDDLGMTRPQIRRVGRCLAHNSGPADSIGP